MNNLSSNVQIVMNDHVPKWANEWLVGRLVGWHEWYELYNYKTYQPAYI